MVADVEKQGNNEATIAWEVREDDDAHLAIMHDNTGNDVREGGGANAEDDDGGGQDNEEEQKKTLGRPVAPNRTWMIIDGLRNS